MNVSFALILAVVLASPSAVPQAPAPPPAFNQIVFVDVHVAAEDGLRIPDLGPGQFEVTVDGNRRRVVVARAARVFSSRPMGEPSDAVVDSAMSYRLGIEPESSDHDGNVHQLVIRVDAGGRIFTVVAPTQIRLPRPTTPPAASAAPLRLTETSTASDVAAWERLWGGREAIAAAETAAAAVVASRVTPPAIADPPVEPPETVAAPTAFDTLFGKYAAGDARAVIRELRTPEDFERVRPELMRALARWRADEWSRSRAAFALEISLTAFARRWPNPSMFLGAARDIVTSRRDEPGTRPEDDEFERRFHRAAVAILAAADGPHGVESYLTSIQHRVTLGGNESKTPALQDARLQLAQAMAREVQTLMLLMSVGSRRDDPRSWVAAKDDGRTRRELESVSLLLERARANDETRAEASVRRAFVLHRLGSNDQALALLEGITTSSEPDEDVEYWRTLIQGRILVALGRHQEAITSFEHATTLFPDAQTPAVALTSLFLKLDDREQALGWAERARTTTVNRDDPWSRYWNGNTRFLARWLADVREAAR